MGVWYFITWHIHRVYYSLQSECSFTDTKTKQLNQGTEQTKAAWTIADYSNVKAIFKTVATAVSRGLLVKRWNTQNLIGSTEVWVSPADWQPARDVPHLRPNVCWESFHKQMGRYWDFPVWLLVLLTKYWPAISYSLHILNTKTEVDGLKTHFYAALVKERYLIKIILTCQRPKQHAYYRLLIEANSLESLHLC